MTYSAGLRQQRSLKRFDRLNVIRPVDAGQQQRQINPAHRFAGGNFFIALRVRVTRLWPVMTV
jgi:hypothetical protein